MRAFIIRPFGQKRSKDGTEIDFDRVERELIDPALEALMIDGRTTQEITRAGNIRVDMLEALVTADLVITDISIHNANAFYELGVRHALREKRTFLIRCEADPHVFDLQTDRYLTYDHDDPGAARDPLVAGLRQSLASDVKDSPVFLLLPELREQCRSLLLTVPQDFSEELQRAAAGRRAGDLALLAEEVRGMRWELEGLRQAGRALFDLKAYASAAETWEAVRRLEHDDAEANQRLATLYQRLGDLARSEQAIARVLDKPELSAADRAELLALRGRNAKDLWLMDWRDHPPEQRQRDALRSPHLPASADAYEEAFEADLNHFYSGLNALAMHSVLEALSSAPPQEWTGRFRSHEEAEQDRRTRARKRQRLTAAVELALEATTRRLQREHRTDVWVEFSAADLACIAEPDSPSRVVHLYRHALRNAPEFAVDSARRQLGIYRDLGVFNEAVEAALEAFPPPRMPDAPGRVLVFTGHRIDDPGRARPRFPADREDTAREAIRATVQAELEQPGGVRTAIAGGASGGDILFHEVCADLGIQSELYLALSRGPYIAASVGSAGPDWVARFDALHQRLPHRELATAEALPSWLHGKPNYGFWERNGLWTLHNALVAGPEQVTLIALWDGSEGDGPGGTKDLIDRARQRGVRTIVLDTKALFGVGR